MEGIKQVNYFKEEMERDIQTVKDMFSLDDIQNQDIRWIYESLDFIINEIYLFTSVYMKWCMAINGLELAVEKYSDKVWQGEYGFGIEGLRNNKEGMTESTQLVFWEGNYVPNAHESVIPMISSWGIIDINRKMEKFIFELYSIYLKGNPDKLMNGAEYKELRRLHRKKDESQGSKEEWSERIQNRIKEWKNKRSRDNLSGVLIDYYRDTGLNNIFYEEIDGIINDTIEILKFIIELRNSLIHNDAYVSKRLATLSNHSTLIGYNLTEGDKLEMKLIDLQIVELLINRILNFILMQLLGLAKAT